MAISIDWGARIISVPKVDMSLVQTTPFEVRELDLNWFRVQLKDLEDSVEGMPEPDTHSHNTQETLSGVTYAHMLKIINNYTVTIEDGTYAVNAKYANSNIADVMNLNSVSLRTFNAVGLQVVSIGSGLSTDEHNQLMALPSLTDIESSASSAKQADLLRALGLMQENQFMDQTVYSTYQGQKLLTSARIRAYSDAVSVGTTSNVIATYLVTAVWNNDEMTSYKVTKQ